MELSKIKERLRYGDIAKVSNEIGRSRQYVYGVLNGTYNNLSVIKALIERAERNAKEDEEINQRIQQL